MNAMTPDRWRQIRAILDRAHEQQPAQREPFVRSACGDDASLCDEVLSLLRHGDDAEMTQDFDGPDQSDLGTSSGGLESTDGSDIHLNQAEGDTVSAGQVRGGRFEILREYARGGLGVVYLARDHELGRDVALKEIQGRWTNQDARHRFVREAEITGRLEHPGVAPVYSFGEYEGGQLYYAMQLVKGESLRVAIRRFHRGDIAPHRRGPDYRGLEFKRLLRHFTDVCQTIEYAHQMGYIHRDIKPANIHLGHFGETVMLDWGLAKAVTEQDEPSTFADDPSLTAADSDLLTRTDRVPMTPAFASPEQADGDPRKVGPPSDVYSLGATMYTLLTGQTQVPTKASGSLREVLSSIQQGNWVAPRKLQRQIPAALEAICMRAMALRPEDRYASAGELADDVNRFLADEPTTVRRESLWERFGRWQRKYPGLRSGMLAVAAILLISTVGLSALAVRLERARQDEIAAREAATAAHAEKALEGIRRAAGRGDWSAVLVGLDNEVLANYPDPIALELWRVEALHAQNHHQEAAELVAGLAERDDLGDHTAAVHLWQGDILRLSSKRSSALIQQAIDEGLPQAELAYARALLAETTHDAVGFATEAVRHSPFHHRANLVLAYSLAFAGRTAEAKDLSRAMQRLFPNDPNFPVVSAIVATVEYDREGIARQLELARELLDERDVNQLGEVLYFVHDLHVEEDGDSLQSLEILLQIPALMSGLSSLARDDGAQGGLNLKMPPSIQQSWGLFAEGFAQYLTFGQLSRWAAERAAAKVNTAFQTHPEMLFQGVRAKMLWLMGKKDDALAACDQAVEAPTMFPQARERTLARAIVYHHLHGQASADVERKGELFSRAAEYTARHLEFGPLSPATASFGADALWTTDGNTQRARPVVEHAYRLNPNAPGLRLLLAQMDLQDGAPHRAWQLAEEQLVQVPGDPGATQIKQQAQAELEAWQARLPAEDTSEENQPS